LKRRANRVHRGAFACMAAALAAIALVACGGEESQTLTYTVTDQGKGTKIESPSSAETGLAEITLRNESKGDADLQLIRVEGDHSAEEAVEGLEAAMDGKPFPDWFFAGGGTGSTGTGERQTVTQVLKPGTYYAFHTQGSQGPPDPKSIPALKVTGEESSDEVEGGPTVSAAEYAFETEELPSGEVEVDFENGGAQPHHLLASKIVGDATIEDVERSFKTNSSKPPLSEDTFQGTAVIEGGESQKVTLDLEPGRYAFYCFVSDRQGGPPHVLKGMVDEVEVK
jgi:Copper binding proteins, plastocyanin/azurin family